MHQTAKIAQIALGVLMECNGGYCRARCGCQMVSDSGRYTNRHRWHSPHRSPKTLLLSFLILVFSSSIPPSSLVCPLMPASQHTNRHRRHSPHRTPKTLLPSHCPLSFYPSFFSCLPFDAKSTFPSSQYTNLHRRHSSHCSPTILLLSFLRLLFYSSIHPLSPSLLLLHIGNMCLFSIYTGWGEALNTHSPTSIPLHFPPSQMLQIRQVARSCLGDRVKHFLPLNTFSASTFLQQTVTHWHLITPCYSCPSFLFSPHSFIASVIMLTCLMSIPMWFESSKSCCRPQCPVKSNLSRQKG